MNHIVAVVWNPAPPYHESSQSKACWCRKNQPVSVTVLWSSTVLQGVYIEGTIDTSLNNQEWRMCIRHQNENTHHQHHYYIHKQLRYHAQCCYHTRWNLILKKCISLHKTSYPLDHRHTPLGIEWIITTATQSSHVHRFRLSTFKDNSHHSSRPLCWAIKDLQSHYPLSTNGGKTGSPQIYETGPSRGCNENRHLWEWEQVPSECRIDVLHT